MLKENHEKVDFLKMVFLESSDIFVNEPGLEKQ